MTETYRNWEGVSVYTFDPDDPEQVEAMLEAQAEEQWETTISRGRGAESLSDAIRHEAFAVQRTSGVLQHISVTAKFKHEDIVDGLIETSQHDFVRSETPLIGQLQAFTITCDCEPACDSKEDSCRNWRIVRKDIESVRFEFLERDPYAGYSTSDPLGDALEGTREWLSLIGGVYRTCDKCFTANAENARLCVHCETQF